MKALDPHLTARLATSVVLVLLLAAAGTADDWPQWRGLNRDSIWREDFSPGPPKVLWRASVGAGWSSPVVARGRVYLTDARLARPKAKERVLCFEEDSGKPLWSHADDVEYPDWAFTGGEGRGPTATPVVWDGRLYTLGNRGDLLCLGAVKGGVLWRRSLEKDYRVQEFAFNASPLLEGDLLITCVGSYLGTSPSFVIALDKGSGKEVWRAPTEGLTNSSPVVLAAGGRRQLVVWTQGSVTSLDPATGKVLWRERMRTAAQDAVATPVFQDNQLLVSGLMLQLAPDRPAASVLWPDTRAVSRRILSNTSTPTLRGGCVFASRSSGELVCLAADTGKELWKADTVTGLKQGAAIHLTPQGDGMFLYTDRGELIRAKLTARGYQEVGRFPLLEPSYPFAGRKVAWSPPAYADRRVFARSDKELVCASLAATP